MDMIEQDKAWQRRLGFYSAVSKRALAELYDALEAGADPHSPELEKLRARFERIAKRHTARCQVYCAWVDAQIALMRARRRK